MKIVSRSEARKNGSPRYFTGKPCKHGHISERYTARGACCECNRSWMQRNKEKMDECRNRWINENPVRAKENHLNRQRKYYSKNKQKCNEAVKNYYKNNTEKAKASTRSAQAKKPWLRKQWVKNNIDKVRAYCVNRRGRKLGAEGHFNKSDIRKMLINQFGRCNICNCCLPPNYHIDHIRPLSKGGSNWPSNLQLLCPPCNLKKSATVYPSMIKDIA